MDYKNLKEGMKLNLSCLKNDFKEFAKYILPVYGDIKFHKFNRDVSSSKLERVLWETGFFAVKYAAYAWAFNEGAKILNKFYELQATADILKGI